MPIISKKICLIGDFGVGKTSLIRRFVDRQFSDKYLSTVGVKISKKVVDVPGLDKEKPLQIQLMIWDLEGHTKFKSIAPSYIQGSSAAIIVADLTRVETVQNLTERLELFCQYSPNNPMIIAFNKADLLDPEKVGQVMATTDINKHPLVIGTYTTSAKTGDNVDFMFEEISKKLAEINAK
jgi:small GTP-binding protein